MRKIFAFAMVALLSMTVALAAVGCGKKAEDTTTTNTETSAPETTMPMDSTMHDSMMVDTSVHH